MIFVMVPATRDQPGLRGDKMNRFAHWYETQVFSRMLNVADRAFRDDRAQLLGRAQGRVLEIGIGSGNSLPYYTDAVTQLVGIEPQSGLLAQAAAALAEHPQLQARVVLQTADARQLPFPDDSFDTVIAFLVFCTIPDPQVAMHEVYRVLRPGGQLLFFEHVQASEAGLARWQQRINPLWNHIACGCNITRNTRDTILQSGLQLQQLAAFRHPKIWLPLVAPVISGVACKAQPAVAVPASS